MKKSIALFMLLTSFVLIGMEKQLTIINKSQYHATVSYEEASQSSKEVSPYETTKIKLTLPQTITIYFKAINWFIEHKIKQTQAPLIIQELTKLNIAQDGQIFDTVCWNTEKPICKKTKGKPYTYANV